MDARTAAGLLDVQLRTLYAYASRGLVMRVKQGQRSLYARADLERLKAHHDARAGHGPVAGGALHWGEPVLSTRICEVGPDGPRYRGALATALARDGVPFADVCGLLWGAHQVFEAANATRPARAPGARVTRRRSGVDDPLSPIIALLTRRLREEPRSFDGSPELETGRAWSLIQCIAANDRSARGADPADRLVARFAPSRTAAGRRLVNAALVLCADHELNASAFAARIAASTGADLHACLLAAVATFSGPRHGGASGRLEDLLEQNAQPRAMEAHVRSVTTRGGAVPGFGHPLYRNGDPRATTLLALIAEQRSTLGDSAALARLHKLISTTHRVRGEHPNLDAALVALAFALGMPKGAASVVFAVGRFAGWVAHILEQRQSPALLRPRARYDGPSS